MRCDAARQLGATGEVPTELLAAATAEQTWARMTLDRSERLTLRDLLLSLILHSQCEEISNVDHKHPDDADGGEHSTVAGGDDSSPRSFECESSYLEL